MTKQSGSSCELVRWLGHARCMGIRKINTKFLQNEILKSDLVIDEKIM